VRKLWARFHELQVLIDKVAREVGFTPAAEKKFRGELWRLGNFLNRNRLAKVKKNPREYVHRLKSTDADGFPRAWCGKSGRRTYVPTPAGRIAVTDWPVTEVDELVDCPKCLKAISVAKKHRGRSP
jgi:hypothetical protein